MVAACSLAIRMLLDTSTADGSIPSRGSGAGRGAELRRPAPAMTLQAMVRSNFRSCSPGVPSIVEPETRTINAILR